jgi:Uma2 family endonuclease
MAIALPLATPKSMLHRPLLPLYNGDHLTRAEFERRYAAMPGVKKAELIEGVVYMPSPVGNPHSEANASMVGCFFVYCAATPGVRSGENVTVRLDAENEVQPDALLRIDEQCGGQSRIGADNFIEGAPELVVEIAVSSAAYDLHEKMRVYRRTGVREYIVWRVFEEQIDWFVLEDGAYVAQTPDTAGIFTSRVFPGLHLDTAALLAQNLSAVLAALHAGIQTPAHTAFCGELERRQR